MTLYLRSHYGKKSARLRLFGLMPSTGPEIPVEVKARAVERRLETRRLRGTLGKKQRSRIKG